MNNLSRLFEQIKENPSMYLDKPSITNLRSFLDGYLTSRFHLGLDRECSGTKGFNEWMQERVKTNLSQSWAGIILSLCGSEESAFYRFFELFEQFLNRNDSSKIRENESAEKFKDVNNDLTFSQFDIYSELLGSVKKRPGMYLGTSSITRLNMLLRGCSLARKEVGIPPTKPEKEFEGFQSWIQDKYGIKSDQSWAKTILSYSMDEREALGKFFELFEEYLNRDKSLEVDESRAGSSPQLTQIKSVPPIVQS
jgi:hypothetical protein